ncbi:hypothetical protein [Salinarimonas chemoclinalis]|uniref:hypothetical protein n=1 Tax=Salinarimonas chemoclinalis TaxID=3241599 RepID=UPI003555EE3C
MTEMTKRATTGTIRRASIKTRTSRAGHVLTYAVAVAPSGKVRLRKPRGATGSADFEAALARLDALPADFLDWMDDVPAWPLDGPEVLGGRR